MNISCLPWGVLYHRGHTLETYEEWIRFVAQEPALDAVDLIDGSKSLCGLLERREESRRFKPYLAESELPVFMFVSHGDFRVDEIAEEERSRFRFLVEQAAFFGARVFRTISGVREPGGLLRKDILENVVSGLRWLGGIVRDAGLPFIIENHHETTDELILLCDALSDLEVRLNVEIKPAFRYHLDPYGFVERLTPYAACYHLDNFRYDPGSGHWDVDRSGRKFERAVALDEGEIDVHRILSIIKRSGFDGWLTIEYGGLVDSFGKLGKSAQFVRRTWDAL